MTNPAFDRIKQDLETNDIVLFMKGTPDFPMCGFSARVCAVLDHLGLAYKGVNVLDDPSLRQAVKDFTNWPTLPQLYIKGEFVGGCDIVTEMYQTGELQQMLTDKGIKQAA